MAAHVASQLAPVRPSTQHAPPTATPAPQVIGADVGVGVGVTVAVAVAVAVAVPSVWVWLWR